MELTQLRSKSIQLVDEDPALVRIATNTRDPPPPAPPPYVEHNPVPASVPAEGTEIAAAPLPRLMVTSAVKVSAPAVV